MSPPAKASISREGLDASFESEEGRKSTLLLEARLLHEQWQEHAAIAKSAEAARIEVRLASICRDKGLMEKSFVHHFSAVGCWAQAANYFSALELCEELVSNPEIPERLKQRVMQFAESLRIRLAELKSRPVEAELADSKV